MSPQYKGGQLKRSYKKDNVNLRLCLMTNLHVLDWETTLTRKFDCLTITIHKIANKYLVTNLVEFSEFGSQT